MERIDKIIPQNIKNSLKEIGELSCVFYLYYYFNKVGWSVYRNVDEKGYDILLYNEKNGGKKKIEVKTRQRIISYSKNKNKTTHFTLSQIEKESANFLIAFWFEYNLFFIVPTNQLKQTKSNENILYKFIVKINKNGEIDNNSKKYHDNWKIIID